MFPAAPHHSVRIMKQPKVMHFYLEPGLRESAEAGTHNFLGKVADVGRAAGMEIRFSGNSEVERARSDPQAEWAVMHMDPPPHDRAITVRRAYYYPFWSLERTNQRWDFDVARAEFSTVDISAKEAQRFVERWRRKWFTGWQAQTEGHVYVPLQGRLLQHRSFQTCSPLEMIEHVLRHDPMRPIIAALHPKEQYSDAEQQALETLVGKHARFSVVRGGIEGLLPGCDYVVTQNSAAGFAGYVWGKPLVLFGRIDFRHIAAEVSELGPAKAISMAQNMRPDFDAYLYWFLQIMAVNAGRPDAADKIATRLRSFGWPV